MNKLKISLIQSSLVWENPNSNLESFEKKILSASDSDIFVLPEMFTTGFTNNVDKCYETQDGVVIAWMKKISYIKGSAICGSVIFKENEKIYNRFLFVEPQGKVSYYNKRHLFGIGGETDIFEKGDQKVIIEYKSFKILLLVCYDLRFPVWSRNKELYDLIIYTANWPASRRNAWDILLQARAVENQAYVAGVNRIGIDGKDIKYNGGTCILGPKGELMNAAENNRDEIVTGLICKEELCKFRDSFPVLNDMDNFDILL